MAETEAPFETLSDDNHGPLITLVSVALLIVAIIFVAAKLCSVLYFKQRTVVNPMICQQAMTCSTVTIVCLPTLYHIFAGLHSGLITTRLPDEVELKHTHPYGHNSTPGSHGSKGKGPTELATIDSVVSVKRKSTIKRSSFSDSTKRLTDGEKGGGVLMTVDITVEFYEKAAFLSSQYDPR
ncbi:integral membrane protein [Aspergillus luchuensis]|uniref:Integral membrane protein n=1 Tax=Aspergillus kawachii TaxID=1069201 RepID=A0A146EXX0_ASPKA|nr:integral membrane protein [Aspergillus luchuensis]